MTDPEKTAREFCKRYVALLEEKERLKTDVAAETQARLGLTEERDRLKADLSAGLGPEEAVHLTNENAAMRQHISGRDNRIEALEACLREAVKALEAFEEITGQRCHVLDKIRELLGGDDEQPPRPSQPVDAWGAVTYRSGGGDDD